MGCEQESESFVTDTQGRSAEKVMPGPEAGPSVAGWGTTRS